MHMPPSSVEFKSPGGTVFGLFKMGNKRVKRPNGGWQIMLRVKDIEKSVASLKRKGIRCNPIESMGGGQLCFFLDPDGNRLVLLQFQR